MSLFSLTERVHRLLSPAYGARVNAEQALEEMADRADGVVLHGSDLALFSGHPSGLSRRRAVSRLESPLWDAFPGHVALLDTDGVVVSVNRRWREFAQRDGGLPSGGLGMNYLDICARGATDNAPGAATAREILSDALAGKEPDRRLDYPVDPDGCCWFRMQVVPLPGRHSGVLVIHSDVSADKQREQEWRRRALHDPLTGLANRALLADRLDHAVAGSARDPRSLAVLFIDLDHFKLVNDRFGHDAGDQVLREAARRFAGSVRAADTVGRWGGDEFLVVAERLTGDSTAEDLAARLAASLDTPIRTDAGEFRVAASVGIAYLDQHQHADQLIRAADEQLQTGRHLRRNLPSAPRPREPVPVG